MGMSLNNIGIVHANKGDYDKALDYYDRSLAIDEELGDKSGMGASLNNIGLVHADKGDYDKALDYNARSLKIREELGDKSGIGNSLGNIGLVHANKGDYDKALDYYDRSLAIEEELGDKSGMGRNLGNIGLVHYYKCNLNRVVMYLEKVLAIQKEIGLGEGDLIFETTTYLYLTYKHLSKDYDVKEIHTLIKEAENIEFEMNFRLYQLLEDKSYLDTAYNQIQEKTSVMEDDLKTKFLGYPTPKAIVEEYNKVFKK
jgi:tetratricopeptide (TPR) repeat protein